MLEKNIKIRILEKSDYSQSYLNWFSDPDVVRFSENRKKVFSKKGQIEYIKSFENDKTKFLYGIFFNNIHIGNIEIKIEPQGEDGNFEIGPEWLLEEGFGGHPEGEVVLGTVQQVGVEEYVLGSSLDGDFVQQIYH